MTDQSAAPEAAPAEQSPQQTEQQTQGQTQEQPAVQEPPKVEVKPEQSLKKSFKIKVDQKEEDVDLDLSNEEEIKKHLQLSRVSQKRMQEYSVLRKDVESLVKMLKENPAKILSDPRIGVDIKKFAQDIMNQELEDLQKSPEQREKEKLQRELEDLREKMKADEETRKKSEFERLQVQAEQELSTGIQNALEKGKVPKTAGTVRRMADIMLVALQNGIDLTPDDCIPLLQKGIKEEIQELLGASPEDVMEELLGKDNLSRLRKRNIQKVREAVQTAKDVKSTGADVKPSAVEEKKISMRDFMKGKF